MAKRVTATGPVDGPWTLPEGWEWRCLGDLGEFLNGAAFKPSDWSDNGTPIIRIQNLNNPNRPMNRTTRTVNERLMVRKGDLLVSWSATLDAFLWSREDAWLNQHIFKVIPHENLVDRRYMFFLLKNEIENLKKTEHLHGSTMMHINRGPFLAHLVPVPPIQTQVKVAARIDELFTEVDDGKAALARARDDLATWRKSLLRAAITGELTADWRAANPTDETGTKLLERVLGRSLATTLDPAMPASANLPPIPNTWAWTTVQAAGHVLLGRQRAPEHHTGDHMRPYLRVANVMEGRLDLRDVKMMNFTPREYETFSLRSGDVLLNEGQSPDLLGRPAIYRDEIPGCCFQKTLLRFRPTPAVTSEFALVVFRQYMHGKRFLRESRITTNIGHLTQVRFLPMEFPVPPIAEQCEIVARIASAESAWDREVLDADFASTLRQSILAAAFRGDLA